MKKITPHNTKMCALLRLLNLDHAFVLIRWDRTSQSLLMLGIFYLSITTSLVLLLTLT